MERCTLCGGKVAGNGRCTECGLDNTKNDKKYRLNVHNEKSRMFRHESCEDNLNQTNRKKKESWQKRLEIEAENPVKKESVFEVKEKKTPSQRKREVKKRHQTGTVKKKGKLGKIVRWVVIFSILAEVAGAVLPDLIYELEDVLESFESISLNLGEEIQFPEEISLAEPEKQIWSQEDVGYFELELQPGFYNIGYDIPAGDYQLECLSESAWVNWWDPKMDESDYVCLYSEERQETYEELMDRTCDYHEVSNIIFLSEGSVLFVEECEGILKLSGIAREASGLKEYEPQTGLETVLIEETGEIRYAAGDFPAGVYDLVLKDRLGTAEVELVFGGRTYYFYLNELSSSVRRIPMNEGSQVTMSYSWNEAEVMLVPSY